MKSIRLGFLISMVAVLASCSEKQPLNEVPEQGKIEYEIHYSNSLRDNSVFGFALPKKLCGVYNEYGVKMSSQCGLGIIKGDVVCSTKESFMTMRVDETKFILPLTDFIESIVNLQNTDSAANVVFSNETAKISGWDAKKVNISYKSAMLEDSVNIEMFYVPVPFEREFEFVTDSKIKKLPGLIVAMNVSCGDMNVMIIMKDIEAADISKDEFTRPSGYRTSTVQQVDSMVMSFF